MRISYNEIEVLCRKVFSGIGYSEGGYEDAALMVAWAELHGLSGFTVLEKALCYLEEEKNKSFSITYQDEVFTIIDAKYSSVLTCGAVIIDLVAAKSIRQGSAALRLSNVCQRKLLLGYLSKYALQGHYISVMWQENPKMGYIANYNAGDDLPIIRRYDTNEEMVNFPKAHSMTILFSRQLSFGFTDIDVPYATLALETRPDNLKLFKESTYRQGIKVSEDLWYKLKALAANNLVPNSEESRKGAGD